MISPLAKTAAKPALTKVEPAAPALMVTGPRSLVIPAGTGWNGLFFTKQTEVELPDAMLHPGSDYGVVFDVAANRAKAELLTGCPVADKYLGGFHFAPGGNARAREGGDSEPAINPRSAWDIAYRPACADPRGMALIEGPRGSFWCDIYLTCADHLADGTSSFGKTIADGSSPPQQAGGGRYANFDYETAVAVLAHHGKQVPALDEFFAATYGVTEKTARGRDPRTTGLDAPRTSQRGLMQATGNLWVWGHDGDPDMPRPSFFGGSWLSVQYAGSRFAVLGGWPDYSNVHLGARGRCDHLQLD